MSQAEAIFCRTPVWRAAARHVILPWALQGFRPRGSVLEIGGGSGAMAAGLVAGSEDGTTLTVTDFDPAMVAAARANVVRADSRISARVADATHLPFDDGSFDAVVSFLMLHHVIDWEEALAEAVRVLRPGGTLAGYDLLSTAAARVVHRLDRSPHRFIERSELEPALAALPLRDLSVAHSPGLARFRATKA
ncbi:class I SAM-dependent methyltransferase [Tsukamurella sp. 1534]|uniref:class I SAM-dependent methyltransferase n=1 Tax=Tsukamurella sp. 1534 TaxID=1151061 RepID=UPI001FEF0567|nr:class I SAM-dependent methyltransferase [Tsukamurella sp. 1534]